MWLADVSDLVDVGDAAVVVLFKVFAVVLEEAMAVVSMLDGELDRMNTQDQTLHL